MYFQYCDILRFPEILHFEYDLLDVLKISQNL